MNIACLLHQPGGVAHGSIESHQGTDAIVSSRGEEVGESTPTEPGHGHARHVRVRYLLKEDFQQLWNYESTAWAAKFLDQWCRQVMRSRIEPMKKVARTLRAHRELILNYFRARKEFSSGVIEGLNNKAKVTMRKSYGFRTFRVTELALYHSLGKLPEPELTHRFF